MIRITIKTATEVARISGAPGNFGVTFKAAGTKTEWDAPQKVTVDQQDLITKGDGRSQHRAEKIY